MVKLGMLEERGWLSEQPAPLRALIASAGRWHDLAPGQILYSYGDPADDMYGLSEGALLVSVPVETGDMVPIHRAEPGFWIGESAVFAEAPRVITIHALRPSRVLRVPGTALRRIVSEEPLWWRSFYFLSHRNATAALRLLGDVLALSPTARVARRLLELSDGGRAVNTTREELATLAGATRPTVQRALATFVAEGALETGYRTILVRDRRKLEAHAAPTV